MKVTRLAIKLKRAISKRFSHFIVSSQLNEVGKDFICDESVKVYGGESILVGDNVVINRGVLLQSCEGAKIELGDNVTLSYDVKLITGNLSVQSLRSGISRSHNSNFIKLGNNIWIGANTIILPGVSIADNVVIGAGSLVNKSLEEGNCLYAGNPARRIKCLEN